ncbi:AsmA family protein [Povalibacter sp.]|uniref:AsmA family protein n=1 Tax=Povalibacter sp. TaxID=1962978 RepID=UPI002F42AD17
MRVFKIAAVAVGAVLALIVVAVTLVVLFVDPNDYRDDIATLVENKTGRKLTLSGDLKLSVFPWIALETGAASLSERQGFGDEPFVSIDGARLSVRLWPLLRGQLEIGNVKLQGARIRLITDEQGRENWADLTEGNKADETAADKPASLPTLAGLEIRDSSITMEDRQARSRRVVRDFNLETGRFQSGTAFPLKTDFVLDEGASLSLNVHVGATVTADLESNKHQFADPQIDVTVSGQGYPSDGIPVQVRAQSLSLDIGQELYQLDGLRLTTTWKGDGIPPAGVPVALQAQQLTANLATQKADLSEFSADVAGASLTGALHGEEILDNPRLSGPLRLAPISLREWLPKLGVAVPVTADPQVLKAFSFLSDVSLTKEAAELKGVDLKLDDTSAKGSLGIANFATKALRFDLDVDRIDADRYLEPPADAPAKKVASKEKSPPVDIPIDALRELNARGELRVGEAIFSRIKFTRLRLGVNARDGKVRLNPSEASIYGGTYRGDIGIDASGESAHVSLNEQVSGVDFAPLFKQLLDTDRFSGKGNATIKAVGTGRNSDELLRTLDGNIAFSVADGALEGTDLWYEIRRARAVLKQQAVPERAVPVRTTFESLKGTGVIDNGRVQSNDLDVSMQYLKIGGKGSLDLPTSALDYQLLATVLKIPREGVDASQMQDLVDAEIPVKVTGTLDDPKVRPDIEGYAKGRVKEELKKQEEKLRDKLGDKLKDLFNR